MALISYSCSEGGERAVSSARFTCGGVRDVRAESDTGFRAWSSSVCRAGSCGVTSYVRVRVRGPVLIAVRSRTLVAGSRAGSRAGLLRVLVRRLVRGLVRGTGKTRAAEGRAARISVTRPV